MAKPTDSERDKLLIEGLREAAIKLADLYIEIREDRDELFNQLCEPLPFSFVSWVQGFITATGLGLVAWGITWLVL